jgi:hypothetical protein
LLLIYWLVFVGYTITKYVQGGTGRVVAYYYNLVCEYRLDVCQWNWRAFLFAQGAYLAATLLLGFFELRTFRKLREAKLGQR